MKLIQKHVKKLPTNSRASHIVKSSVWILSFAAVGTMLLLFVQAAPSDYKIEPESSTLSNGTITGNLNGVSHIEFRALPHGGAQIPIDQLPKGNPLYADSRILLSPTP